MTSLMYGLAVGAGSFDAVSGLEATLNRLGQRQKREVESKGVELPRRRESGATLTSWMSSSPWSNEESDEGSSWWLDIALGQLRVVEARLV